MNDPIIHEEAIALDDGAIFRDSQTFEDGTKRGAFVAGVDPTTGKLTPTAHFLRCRKTPDYSMYPHLQGPGGGSPGEIPYQEYHNSWSSNFDNPVQHVELQGPFVSGTPLSLEAMMIERAACNAKLKWFDEMLRIMQVRMQQVDEIAADIHEVLPALDFISTPEMLYGAASGTVERKESPPVFDATNPRHANLLNFIRMQCPRFYFMTSWEIADEFTFLLVDRATRLAPRNLQVGNYVHLIIEDMMNEHGRVGPLAPLSNYANFVMSKSVRLVILQRIVYEVFEWALVAVDRDLSFPHTLLEDDVEVEISHLLDEVRPTAWEMFDAICNLRLSSEEQIRATRRYRDLHAFSAIGHSALIFELFMQGVGQLRFHILPNRNFALAFDAVDMETTLANDLVASAAVAAAAAPAFQAAFQAAFQKSGTKMLPAIFNAPFLKSGGAGMTYGIRRVVIDAIMHGCVIPLKERFARMEQGAAAEILARGTAAQNYGQWPYVSAATPVVVNFAGLVEFMVMNHLYTGVFEKYVHVVEDAQDVVDLRNQYEEGGYEAEKSTPTPFGAAFGKAASFGKAAVFMLSQDLRLFERVPRVDRMHVLDFVDPDMQIMYEAILVFQKHAQRSGAALRDADRSDMQMELAKLLILRRKMILDFMRTIDQAAADFVQSITINPHIVAEAVADTKGVRLPVVSDAFYPALAWTYKSIMVQYYPDRTVLSDPTSRGKTALPPFAVGIYSPSSPACPDTAISPIESMMLGTAFSLPSQSHPFITPASAAPPFARRTQKRRVAGTIIDIQTILITTANLKVELKYYCMLAMQRLRIATSDTHKQLALLESHLTSKRRIQWDLGGLGGLRPPKMHYVVCASGRFVQAAADLKDRRSVADAVDNAVLAFTGFVLVYLFTPSWAPSDGMRKEYVVGIDADPFAVLSNTAAPGYRVFSVQLECRPGCEGMYRVLLYHPAYGHIFSDYVMLKVQQKCVRTGKVFEERKNRSDAAEWSVVRPTFTGLTMLSPMNLNGANPNCVREEHPEKIFERVVANVGWHSADTTDPFASVGKHVGDSGEFNVACVEWIQPLGVHRPTRSSSVAKMSSKLLGHLLNWETHLQDIKRDMEEAKQIMQQDQSPQVMDQLYTYNRLSRRSVKSASTLIDTRFAQSSAFAKAETKAHVVSAFAKAEPKARVVSKAEPVSLFDKPEPPVESAVGTEKPAPEEVQKEEEVVYFDPTDVIKLTDADLAARARKELGIADEEERKELGGLADILYGGIENALVPGPIIPPAPPAPPVAPQLPDVIRYFVPEAPNKQLVDRAAVDARVRAELALSDNEELQQAAGLAQALVSADTEHPTNNPLEGIDIAADFIRKQRAGEEKANASFIPNIAAPTRQDLIEKGQQELAAQSEARRLEDAALLAALTGTSTKYPPDSGPASFGSAFLKSGLESVNTIIVAIDEILAAEDMGNAGSKLEEYAVKLTEIKREVQIIERDLGPPVKKDASDAAEGENMHIQVQSLLSLITKTQEGINHHLYF